MTARSRRRRGPIPRPGRSRRPAQIARVYDRSPFYRAKYDAAGFEPSTLRSPADLARVPMFEKDDERSSQRSDPPLAVIVRLAEEVVRIQASSGRPVCRRSSHTHSADLETCDTIIGRLLLHARDPAEAQPFGLLGNLSMFVAASRR